MGKFFFSQIDTKSTRDRGESVHNSAKPRTPAMTDAKSCASLTINGVNITKTLEWPAIDDNTVHLVLPKKMGNIQVYLTQTRENTRVVKTVEIYNPRGMRDDEDDETVMVKSFACILDDTKLNGEKDLLEVRLFGAAELFANIDALSKLVEPRSMYGSGKRLQWIGSVEHTPTQEWQVGSEFVLGSSAGLRLSLGLSSK